MVVLTPGSTLNGETPKYFSHIHSSVCCTGGTTFEMATARICWACSPRVRSRVSMNTPYSSAVCSRRLVSRQEARRRASSKTPITVLVLPTSATSNMVHLPRHDPVHVALRLHHQRPLAIQVTRHAGDAVDRHAAAQSRRQLAPPRADGRESQFFQARAPAVEALDELVEEVTDVRRARGLEEDRGGAAGKVAGELALVDVDPDAHRHHWFDAQP